MSTLRDAHVSHNSIPGPQGVQSSGETAPVMGRSSHHHAVSPLIRTKEPHDWERKHGTAPCCKYE